jgi:hypothetical protein
MIITIDPNVQYPRWVYETWRISTGLDTGQTVTFRSNASATEQAQAWGRLTTTTATQVAGETTSLPLQAFSIDCFEGQLICFSWPPTTSGRRSLRRIGAIALGVSAGALIGIGVGLAAGFLGSSFFTILATAFIASMASVTGVHIIMQTTKPVAGGGPSPTWVANDGGAAGLAAKTQSPLKMVGA